MDKHLQPDQPLSSPVVFVGGCPRSGTTLLQRMLDNHPQLAVANDTHFVHRALQTTSRSLESKALKGEPIPLSDELREAVWNYHRFYRLGVSRAEFDRTADSAATYVQLVSRLFQTFADKHDKALAGEKTPDYVRHIPLLLKMFPHAKFVHIVRDGRDVALSLNDWASPEKGPGRFSYWEHDPVAVSALWWSDFVSAGWYAGGRNDRVLTMQYEAILEDVAGELKILCQHLCLPFSSQMAAFHHGRQAASHAHGSAKKDWLPATKGLRNWRDKMSTEDVVVFQALAGDWLKEFGYELWDVQPNERAAQRIASAQQWYHAGHRRSSPTRLGHCMTAPSDDQLIKRDPDIPGLRWVLDPPSLRDFAVRHDPTFKDFRDATVDYVRYKPRTSCMSVWRLQTSHPVGDPDQSIGPDRSTEARTMVAITHSERGRSKIEKLQSQVTTDPADFGRPVLDSKHHILMFPFPLDPRLPELVNNLGADGYLRNLPRGLLKGDWPIDRLRWNVLSYKPLRRCVIGLSMDGNPVAVVRYYRPRAYANARRAFKYLHRHDAFDLSRRLGQSDRHCCLAVRWLPGRPLDLSTGRGGAEQMSKLGRLLAQVHESPHAKLPTIPLQRSVKWMAQSQEMLQHLRPELSATVARVIAIIDGGLQRSVARYTRIHGDFHAGQILDCGGKLGILDWDQSANGPAGFDIASFASHLLVANLLSESNGLGEAKNNVETFVVGYCEHADSQLSQSWPLYVALGLIRGAVVPFRIRHADWSDKVSEVVSLAANYLVDAGYSSVKPAARLSTSEFRPSKLAREISKRDDAEWVRQSLDRKFARSRLLPFVKTDTASDGYQYRLTSLDVVKHNPARRCVIRYGIRHTDGNGVTVDQSVFGKVRARGADVVACDIQQRIHDRVSSQSTELSVARPLGVLPKANLWLQSEVLGRPAEQMLRDKCSPHVSWRIGQALAKLHRLEIIVDRHHTYADEVDGLKRSLDRVARKNPQWSRRLQSLTRNCEELLDSGPRNPLTGIHRDFYPAQVLVAASAIGIVDLDLFAHADPAIDVANYIAHLKEQSLRDFQDPNALREHEESFLQGYLQTNGNVSRTAIRLLTVVSLSRHVYISRRIPARQQATESILSLCEELVAEFPQYCKGLV